jgi:ABC-type multidrug transport system fused ATPase/permease subunit
MRLLVLVVVAQLALTLVTHAVSVVSHYAMVRLELGMTLDFRSDMFRRIQELSIAYHDQRQSGMVIYILNAMDHAPTDILMSLLPFAQNLLTLVGMVWVTYKMDAELALLSMTVVPVLYYAIGYYVRNVQRRVDDVRGLEGGALGIVHEALAMLRVIVAFGREGHEYRRMRDQGERANVARIGLTVRQTVFALCVDTTTSAGSALVLGVGAYHVLQHSLTVGELLIVMSYVGSVYKPLEAISSTIAHMQGQVRGLQMAFDMLDTRPAVVDAPGAADVGRAQGRITFDQVDFQYATRPETLREISFDVPPGSVVAVVGPTGAGKTTLLSLISRFYDTTAGRVLLDGRDVRDISLRSLREQISIVMQEPLLFSTSILENIRYGRLDATDDEVMEAARLANAHDFIMKLPEGYATAVGERGGLLSGGERQRICIARAFLKDAPILLLDEPTSSVDPRTEATILTALDRLIAGRTTFIVTHRLASVRHADMVLVVDQGRIVERGTHDELLEQDGLYRQLHTVVVERRKRKAQALLAEPLALRTTTS